MSNFLKNIVLFLISKPLNGMVFVERERERERERLRTYSLYIRLQYVVFNILWLFYVCILPLKTFMPMK